MKKIVVIDGQGGKLGRRIIEEALALCPDLQIRAVGTNSAATAEMLKGGAVQGATGENSIIVACRTADFIVGPIGIICADALLGEITPAAAAAVGASDGHKVLLPVSKCGISVAGAVGKSMSSLITEAAKLIAEN